MNSTMYAAHPVHAMPQPARRRGISAGKATAWAFLAVALGASWGLLSIAALRAQRLDLLNVTDSWWAWGVFLFVLALLPGGAFAKFSYVLLGGAASITVYYVLKAYWAVGYPSHARSFSAYFQADNYAYFMGIVALAAPALGVGVAIIAKLFKPRA